MTCSQSDEFVLTMIITILLFSIVTGLLKSELVFQDSVINDLSSLESKVPEHRFEPVSYTDYTKIVSSDLTDKMKKDSFKLNRLYHHDTVHVDKKPLSFVTSFVSESLLKQIDMEEFEVNYSTSLFGEIYPDPFDYATILSLAKMSFNAYLDIVANKTEWLPVPGYTTVYLSSSLTCRIFLLGMVLKEYEDMFILIVTILWL
jgi:hypothetical protein